MRSRSLSGYSHLTGAIHSWEIGTVFQAMTELEWPELSVLTGDLPPPHTLEPGQADYIITRITEYVLPLSQPRTYSR